MAAFMAFDFETFGHDKASNEEIGVILVLKK
jgi:hypothetical protein